MRNGSFRGKFERKNILFYKLDLNLSLIFMLNPRIKLFNQNLARGIPISFEFFPNYKAHQQNNNRGNSVIELDLTKHRDKYKN